MPKKQEFLNLVGEYRGKFQVVEIEGDRFELQYREEEEDFLYPNMGQKYVTIVTVEGHPNGELTVTIDTYSRSTHGQVFSKFHYNTDMYWETIRWFTN